MVYIQTGEKLDNIKKIFSNPQFYVKIIPFTYLTKMDVVERLLPPPLKPSRQPVVMASAFDMNSNCVGQFQGASFWLACRYGKINGWYCLSMPVNSDSALIFGREIYAEPKKMAAIAFEQNNKSINVSVKRLGVEIARMHVKKQKQLDPVETAFTAFHFKYSFFPDGSGFAYGPFLVAVENKQENELAFTCEGDLKLFKSEYDPVADVEIEQLKQVRYYEGTVSTRGRILSPVDPETFWPHLFSRMDSPLLWES